MTWPRGARCTDPEEMPEMEARAPAQNRHGGAPRGARPPLGDDKALRKRLACRAKARSRASWTRFGTPRVPLHPSAVSALRHPSGVDEGRLQTPGAMRRGNEKVRVANGGNWVFYSVLANRYSRAV